MAERKSATARDTALDVLMQVSGANAWSDGSLKRTIAKNGLDSRDAALATRLAYGVIQNRMLLDYYIGCFCTQKPQKLEPVVLNVLRLGGYQILFMDKIPQRAAVYESVELVKRRGRARSAGLVNAVLRRFVTNWLDMPALPAGSAAETLSVRYSHPLWLVEQLLARLGEEETEKLLAGNNEVTPTSVQTNTTQITPEALEKELRSEGVQVESHPWLSGCFLVSSTGDLTDLPSFAKGHFWVQDAAARLVALAAQPAGEERILDVCAAPGGKSFALAADRQDAGRITACDVHPHKLQLLQRGAQRLGLHSIETLLADGRVMDEARRGAYDLVVADVPCSGLGIIRKKPDIRYKNPAELEKLPELQRAILENAGAYVRPGGVLIYSTCTLLREENEDVIAAFLAEHAEFTREDFDLPAPIGHVEGEITLWPQQYGTDGFYICRMRKRTEKDV